MVGEVEIGTASDKLVKDKIPEEVAEDHARLLGIMGRCLAEIGIKASLTTFHICEESRHQADRLLIRTTAVGPGRSRRPETGQTKGTHQSGQIRSESPGITDTDPDGNPPRTAGKTLTDP